MRLADGVGGPATVLLAIVLAAAAVGVQGSSETFERYRIPELRSFKGWHNEFAPHSGSGGRRKLQQPGLFTPGHTNSTSCTVRIVGTKKLLGVKSAKVFCTTTDDYWLKPPFNGRILVYAGRPLYDLYEKYPQNWKGIMLQLPNEPDFLYKNNTDPVLFFVQAGKVKFTGYVKNMAVVDWAVMHIENGTDARFENFLWSNNLGHRFPTVAGARSTLTVKNCRFINNVCTNATRCHTPGVYVTEGERATITNTLFSGNKGHLSGAVMITSGALANISNCTFKSNNATLDGTFGGAIFHDFCDRDARTFGGKSTFNNNTFENNNSEGFGGAIRLGSPDGGCPKTAIKNSIFKSNRAKYTGGAIHVSYCHGVRPQFYQNKFIGNSAAMFNGQIGYNPTTYPQQQTGTSGKPTPSGVGCPTPSLPKCTFTGTGTAKFSPPWFFP